MKQTIVFPFVFLFAMLITYIANAQLVDIESQRLRTDTTRVAGMAGISYSYKQTNNLKLTEFDATLTLQMRSKSKRDIFLVLGSYEVLKTASESFSNNGFGHVRYTHKFSSFFRMEAFSQYQEDENLLLESRVLAGTGPRIRVFNRKNADSAFGCLYMAEWESTIGILPQSALYHRISSYLSFDFTFFDEQIEIASITYYQPLITDFDDCRITNNTSLSLKIIKDLVFQTGVKYSFDSNPPVGVINNTFSTTMGVKYKF